MTGNYASATEQFSLAATAGISYNFSTSLADLTRAQVIAKQYSHYRITGVEFRLKPWFDTYAPGQPNQMPYIYWVLDKGGVLGSPTAPQFEELGAKQVRLDDRTVVRKWKPAVVPGDANTALASGMKTSPWLPIIDTQSGVLNTPKHHGCAFLITKMSPVDAVNYDIDVIVHIQFKRPYVATNPNSTVEPPRVRLEETYANPLP